MSSIRHHPRIETLGEFAAGRLDEARSVVIATHAAQCPQCSKTIADLESMGGFLLDSVEPVPMTPGALERILSQPIAQNAPLPAAAIEANTSPERRQPLRALLGGGLDEIKWRPVAPGLAQSVVPAQGYRKGVLRLLKIKPGTTMPRHSHKGGELTLILRGAYDDELGNFGVGDLADLDGDHTHSPKAVGDEPCICLIATAAPLAFKTMAGRIAQPFIGL